MKSIMNFLFVCFIFFLSAASINAASVFITDGSIIEGQIIKDTDASMSVKMSNNIETVIPRNKILRILYDNQYKNSVNLYKADGTVIKGFIIDEQNLVYIVRKELNSPIEIEVKKSDVDAIVKEGKERKLGESEIARQKTEKLKNFSTVYFDIALIFTSPMIIPNNQESTAQISGATYTLPYRRDSLFGIGGGMKITLTNSYSSFVLFGGSIEFAYLYSGYTQFSNSFDFTSNIQALLGLNWNINNKFFIQPYIQVGPVFEYALMLPGDHTSERPNYTLSSLTTPPSKTLYIGVIISLGIKFPIRVGKDLFLTPFVEIMAIPDNRITAIAGIGLSF